MIVNRFEATMEVAAKFALQFRNRIIRPFGQTESVRPTRAPRHVFKDVSHKDSYPLLEETNLYGQRINIHSKNFCFVLSDSSARIRILGQMPLFTEPDFVQTLLQAFLRITRKP